MDFQTCIATETSSLIERLLARRCASSQQQLDAVRDALETAARALDSPIGAEQEILEVVGRLTEAANAAIQRVREEAQSSIDAAQGEARAHLAEVERLRAEVVEAQADAAILRSDLEMAQARSAAVNRELEETIEAHAALQGAMGSAEAGLRSAVEAREAIEGQLADARAAIDLMLVETEQLRTTCESDAAERASMQGQLAQAHETAAERHAIAGELQEAAARLHALEGELGAAREQSDAARVQLEAATARIQALEGEIAFGNEARERRDAIAWELEASTARIEALESAGRRQDEHNRTLEGRLGDAARIEATLREEPVSHRARSRRVPRRTVASTFRRKCRIRLQPRCGTGVRTLRRSGGPRSTPFA
jgi:chromosome segregation ATPase